MSGRWACLPTLLLFWVIANIGKADAASTLTIAHIARGEQAVTSASDVIELSLDGKVLHRGINVGATLPDDVRVEVPANVTLVIASVISTATLQPGSTDTFAWAGARESVTITVGRTTFDDPLGLYQVNAGPISESHESAAFSVAVDSKTVTITATDGEVDATRVGSVTGSAARRLWYVEQGDRISAPGRSSVTYTLGQESTAAVEARVQVYRLAAAQRDADAEFNLGTMYYFSHGVPRNYATALHYYRLAAAQGNTYSENNLGFVYQHGYGVPRNYVTAVHYYQIAAAQGNAYAENSLGTMYDLGHGVPRNYASALHYYQLAAVQSNTYGEDNLGFMYYFGHGVPRNYATAVHYYQLAAAQGNAYAENQLGTMYVLGHGVPRNYATAVHYYQLAAAQGEAYAETNLGFVYEYGYGVPRNYATAVYYYRLAAAQGDAYSQNHLGTMYVLGHGVPRNYATAVYYYRLAAAQADPDGENSLGGMYDQGRGVPQNYTTAVHYYRLSAAQGDVRGQNNLGFMYYFGHGVPRNYTTALYYLRLSAAQGNTGAAAMVIEISKLLKQRPSPMTTVAQTARSGSIGTPTDSVDSAEQRAFDDKAPPDRYHPEIRTSIVNWDDQPEGLAITKCDAILKAQGYTTLFFSIENGTLEDITDVTFEIYLKEPYPGLNTIDFPIGTIRANHMFWRSYTNRLPAFTTAAICSLSSFRYQGLHHTH